MISIHRHFYLLLYNVGGVSGKSENEFSPCFSTFTTFVVSKRKNYDTSQDESTLRAQPHRPVTYRGSTHGIVQLPVRETAGGRLHPADRRHRLVAICTGLGRVHTRSIRLAGTVVRREPTGRRGLWPL